MFKDPEIVVTFQMKDGHKMQITTTETIMREAFANNSTVFVIAHTGGIFLVDGSNVISTNIHKSGIEPSKELWKNLTS